MATLTHEPTPATLLRACAKSEEQTLALNLPRLMEQEATPYGTRQVWAVASRTTGGTVYLLDALLVPGQPPQIACECEARTHCWHRTHAARAIAGEIPHYTSQQQQPAAVPARRLA